MADTQTEPQKEETAPIAIDNSYGEPLSRPYPLYPLFFTSLRLTPDLIQRLRIVYLCNIFPRTLSLPVPACSVHCGRTLTGRMIASGSARFDDYHGNGLATFLRHIKHVTNVRKTRSHSTRPQVVNMVCK